MVLSPEDVLKILLAVTAGGLIGIEREFRDKAAGFRTLIFICAGACLFTMLSFKLAVNSDPTRIAANILTGVGFIGAGVILRDGGKVIGLTTAAMIWLTAAIGMGIGGGQYLVAGVVLVVTMIILWLLPLLEHRVDNLREERRYEVTCSAGADKYEALERTFSEYGLHVKGHSQQKNGERMTCVWITTGSPQKHKELMHRLFDDPEIEELKC